MLQKKFKLNLINLFVILSLFFISVSLVACKNKDNVGSNPSSTTNYTKVENGINNVKLNKNEIINIPDCKNWSLSDKSNYEKVYTLKNYNVPLNLNLQNILFNKTKSANFIGFTFSPNDDVKYDVSQESVTIIRGDSGSAYSFHSNEGKQYLVYSLNSTKNNGEFGNKLFDILVKWNDSQSSLFQIVIDNSITYQTVALDKYTYDIQIGDQNHSYNVDGFQDEKGEEGLGYAYNIDYNNSSYVLSVNDNVKVSYNDFLQSLDNTKYKNNYYVNMFFSSPFGVDEITQENNNFILSYNNDFSDPFVTDTLAVKNNSMVYILDVTQFYNPKVNTEFYAKVKWNETNQATFKFVLPKEEKITFENKPSSNIYSKVSFGFDQKIKNTVTNKENEVKLDDLSKYWKKSLFTEKNYTAVYTLSNYELQINRLAQEQLISYYGYSYCDLTAYILGVKFDYLNGSATANDAQGLYITDDIRDHELIKMTGSTMQYAVCISTRKKTKHLDFKGFEITVLWNATNKDKYKFVIDESVSYQSVSLDTYNNYGHNNDGLLQTFVGVKGQNGKEGLNNAYTIENNVEETFNNNTYKFNYKITLKDGDIMPWNSAINDNAILFNFHRPYGIESTEKVLKKDSNGNILYSNYESSQNPDFSNSKKIELSILVGPSICDGDSYIPISKKLSSIYGDDTYNDQPFKYYAKIIWNNSTNINGDYNNVTTYEIVFPAKNKITLKTSSADIKFTFNENIENGFTKQVNKVNLPDITDKWTFKSINKENNNVYRVYELNDYTIPMNRLAQEQLIKYYNKSYCDYTSHILGLTFNPGKDIFVDEKYMSLTVTDDIRNGEKLDFKKDENNVHMAYAADITSTTFTDNLKKQIKGFEIIVQWNKFTKDYYRFIINTENTVQDKTKAVHFQNLSCDTYNHYGVNNDGLKYTIKGIRSKNGTEGLGNAYSISTAESKFIDVLNIFDGDSIPYYNGPVDPDFQKISKGNRLMFVFERPYGVDKTELVKDGNFIVSLDESFTSVLVINNNMQSTDMSFPLNINISKILNEHPEYNKDKILNLYVKITWNNDINSKKSLCHIAFPANYTMEKATK